MVALMRNVITRKPQGIHRTALKDDGSGKRVMPVGVQPKSMLGPAKGAAVMFQSASTCLGIAEGIETALSAHKIFSMPVWAVMSAPGIAAFPIVSGLTHLKIFADHDDAGITAASKCGRRYKMSGIAGEIHIPPIVKSDWNDCLMERA
jgi:hypothetical protein